MREGKSKNSDSKNQKSNEDVNMEGTKEQTGESESLAGKIIYKFGDKAKS